MGLWQLMLCSGVTAQRPFPSSWVNFASGQRKKSKKKEVSTLSSSIYQHMTHLCLEHTLHCSGGKHGSFDNISGKRRDKQGCKTQAGYRHVSVLHLCGAASYENWATFLFFSPHKNSKSHLRVNVATFVGSRGKKTKNYLDMKCTVLTSGERLADTFDKSPPPTRFLWGKTDEKQRFTLLFPWHGTVNMSSPRRQTRWN